MIARQRAERWYGAALRLLPSSFRSSYGAELQRDFSELLRHSASSAVLWLTVKGVLDVVQQSLRERRRTRGGGRRLWGQPRGRRALPGEVIMHWWSEFRLAGRALASRPGFTLAAILTLALGIGANVAIFAVVDSVLIQPLPYPESERVVVIDHHAPGIIDLPSLQSSHGMTGMYQDWARSFSHVALTDGERYNMTGGDRPAQVRAMRVTPNFFDVLRVEPARGRRFNEGDDLAGTPRAVILSHTAWQTRFGGEPVLGRTIHVDGNPVEVVGIMPSGFTYPDAETEVFVPMNVYADAGFGTFGQESVARLRDGVTVEAADREVKALQQRLPERYPDLNAEFMRNAQWSGSVTALRDVRVRDVKTALLVVLATVCVVLLIACANVANLFLVRAEGRQRELAIRSALGAGRSRLTWGYLSESLWLGIGGGIAGTAAATVGVRALVASGPAQLPRLHEVNMDARTLLFAALLSVVAGIVFGILPMLRPAQRALDILREGRSATGTRERHRVRSLLIAGQVALALVLLVGSGLMLRSFQRLRAVDVGVTTENILTLGISLGRADRAAAAQFYQQVLDETAALPGVQSVSATNSLPLQPGGINGGSFTLESRPTEAEDLPPTAMWAIAAPNYFETLDIPVRTGRTLERRDHETGAQVVWVSEQFVKAYLDGADPLGERLRIGGEQDSTWLEIAGVVGDVLLFGITEAARPMIYLPMSTTVQSTNMDVMYLVVKTAGAPTSVLPSIRAVVERLNGNIPLTTARTMEELAAESMADTSFTMTILGIAAVVALLLGAIGLYGVITYVVAQRTREMGVRIALGAAPQKVQLMVVRQGMLIVGVGVAGGLAAALALTRLMQGLLFGGITPRDPLTFGTVTGVLALVSLAALYLPARRASNVNPMNALRIE